MTKVLDVLFHLAYGFQTVVERFDPVGMTQSELESRAWSVGRRIGTVTLEALNRLR